MFELIYLLVSTHITIICVTLYLHRGQTHRAIEFHPVLSHFMRFWLWLTTGMVTKEWVAIHRKHHRYADEFNDPHSPRIFGIWRVLFSGVLLYNDATKDKKIVEQYGVGTPDDWVERNVYSKYSIFGVLFLLVFNTLVFHGWGIIIWIVQMAWIPFWAAGVINGIGHWFGYRNHNTNDKSRNIFPLGFLIGGEEFHNNHHNKPANAKLSDKWWELDIGWVYLRVLCFLKLTKVT